MYKEAIHPESPTLYCEDGEIIPIATMAGNGYGICKRPFEYLLIIRSKQIYHHCIHHDRHHRNNISYYG